MAADAAAFDPTPPGHGEARVDDRWWGRHLAEFRWQAELARLVVDPVYRGEGVPRGDGAPVVLIPGFLAGDGSLRGHARLAGPDGLRRPRLGHRRERRLLRPRAEPPRARASSASQRGDGAQGRADRPQPRRALRQGARAPPARPRRRRRCRSAPGLDTPFDISVPTKVAVAAVRERARPHQRPHRAQRLLHRALPMRLRRRLRRRRSPRRSPLTVDLLQGRRRRRWEACRVPYARNVEVTGSHVGLAFNRKVYRGSPSALVRALDG